MINYKDRLGARWPTMSLALTMMEARGGRNITETGCAYVEGDWSGAGNSTLVWAEWASHHDGEVTTVDVNADHLEACRRLTVDLREWITYVHMDSVTFLADSAPIDLLYLDSFDYPYGTLLDLYGGKTNLAAAIASLSAMSERGVVERHGEIIAESQQHCRDELLAALPALHDRSIVLIDDADLPGGGKPRLAREFLIAAGWTCVLDAYQTLWAKA